MSKLWGGRFEGNTDEFAEGFQLSLIHIYGRVDFSMNGPSFMTGGRESMGFSEYVIAPEILCVPFTGISFEEGAFLEPLGVAIDFILTADIKMNDDVLVLGLGPIGLMALQMAKRCRCV